MRGGIGGVGTKTTNFSSQKVDFVTNRYYGAVGNIIFILQHPLYHHHGVGIIQLVLILLLYLLFQMVTVKAMWVLGPPTFTHKTLIVGLMVVFFCHIFVVIIHP